MLVIRYNTVGRKNHKQYRIVLQEKTQAPGGRHVAVLGSYDPHTKQTLLKEDKIKDWIQKGAQPSDSVYNLLVKNGVLKGDKRKVKIPEKKVEEVKEETTEVTKEDSQKAEDAPAKDETAETTGEDTPEEDGVKEKPTQEK